MAYGDDVMKAIRGTVLDGRPRIGGVGDAEASARARRAAALSAAADYARSGRGGQGDSDMHLERAAEEALSQAALAGLMTYGRSALALGRRTLADQLARRRASPAAVLRRTRYQGGAFGEGVETLSDTALNPSTLTGARPTGRLGEVATVSEEYSRAYPGIERDVVVNVVPDNEWAGYVEAAKRARAEWAKTSDTSRGFFDRRLSAVSLRAQMPGETMEAYFDRADRTLVHELQHYAQMRDGLPATSPGSGYEWYRTAAREVDARNSANRLVLTPQERAEIPRSMTQDVKPEDVHMDDKGGDNFGTFRNFLATDDVPESIFGYPVVRDESQYTEKDLAFFRENPRAAGFYDLGGEEVDEDVPQQATKGGKATETFDTPIPEELRARYDAWYAQLPKNLQYTGDYDLQGAWLEKLGQPDKYEATQNGHLDDYGKKPNHITFSTGSKWHDPKVPERTGGEWRQAKDGSWDFYPGTGNKASDDELKAYFDKYEKGNRVHGRDVAKDVHGLVQKFKDHVRTYENRRVEPYRDVDGNWAVGYGSHFLADGTKVTPKTAVTDRMIDDAFDADLARRIDLLAGHDRKQAEFAVPNWRYMSPESRLMLLDVSWGRKDTLTEEKSPGLFRELKAAGRDRAALDDAVRRHYPSYRKATDANGAVDESKTAGLQNRRIALLKALTGEDFSYDGKKWSTKENKFVEE